MKKTNPSSSSKDSGADEEQYLYLTTRGRQSGRAREIEIWFTHREGFYYVIAEYDTSHWLQNLQADPHVSVKVGGRHFQAEARVLKSESDLELQNQVQQLSRAKYGWGDGIVVELIPMPS